MAITDGIQQPNLNRGLESLVLYGVYQVIFDGFGNRNKVGDLPDPRVNIKHQGIDNCVN